MADRLTNRDFFQDTLIVEFVVLKRLPKLDMINRILNDSFFHRVFEAYIKDIERQGIRGPSCMTPGALSKWFDEGVECIRDGENHDVRVAEGEEVSPSIIGQQ